MLSLVTLGIASCKNFGFIPEAELNPVKNCYFKTFNVEVESQIDDELRNKIEKNSGPERPFLYISGGSQNGAFGAGVLDGWATSNEGHLPDFSVVTGVSTGALLSLAAFTDTPEAAVNSYTIDDEGELLDVFVSGPDLGIINSYTLIKKGALSDLVPMRQRLREVLQNKEYDIIRKIADKNDNSALLIVLTNIEDGEAYAFDMTDMAVRIQNSRPTHLSQNTKIIESKESDAYLTCFIEALTGSSIVPPAARPVVIDNNYYIDGGARFGVINQMVGSNFMMVERITTPAFLLINGDLTVDVKEHDGYKFVSLAKRSVDILQDQVYKFSREKIINDAEDYDLDLYELHFTMDGQVSTESTLHNLYNGQIETRNCLEWRDVDKTMKPIQFHPHYMRCMIDYGRNSSIQWKRLTD